MFPVFCEDQVDLGSIKCQPWCYFEVNRTSEKLTMSTKSIVMISVTMSVVLAVTWLDYQHFSHPEAYQANSGVTTAVNPDSQMR